MATEKIHTKNRRGELNYQDQTPDCVSVSARQRTLPMWRVARSTPTDGNWHSMAGEGAVEEAGPASSRVPPCSQNFWWRFLVGLGELLRLEFTSPFPERNLLIV